jgi:hypothetical protein
MITIIALCAAYALVKFVPDHSDAPAIKQYGCDDVDAWRRAIQGPVVRVIDGGTGHE